MSREPSLSTEAGKPIASPCVRNCCLDDGDICLGCFRHIEEITGWSAMDDAQRRACLTRCAERRAQRESQERWPFASR